METSIQEWVLNHLQLAEVLNYFYMYAHWTVTPLFFIWLYRRRRRVYPYVRNAFLAANGIALVVFMLYPVAPPRLVGQGFVDTLNRVSDIDLHGGVFSGWFNPHAAVPSMHFGYALMIGMVGLLLLRSWPLRLIALAYPVLVFITITGTANHYVLDAVAGALVVAIGFIGVWALMAARGRLRPSPLPARSADRGPAAPALPPGAGGVVRTERLPWLTMGRRGSITPGTWTSEPPALRPERSVRRDPTPATIPPAGA